MENIKFVIYCNKCKGYFMGAERGSDYIRLWDYPIDSAHIFDSLDDAVRILLDMRDYYKECEMKGQNLAVLKCDMTIQMVNVEEVATKKVTLL